MAAAPALSAILAACGDDSVASSTTGHPTGADDMVLRLGSEGGFVPAEFLFVNLPSLLVAGDGRVYQPGVMIDIFPGPLLPAISSRTITESGIRRLLEGAEDAGLLAPPPDYSTQTMVADVPDTVLTLTTNAGSFVHRAPALGMVFDENGNPGEETSPARQRLAAYVEYISDLERAVGSANLGPETMFGGNKIRFRATPQADVDIDAIDPRPTEVEWPADAPVKLADAADCAMTDDPGLLRLFAEAKQNTLFTDAGVIYSVIAVQVLPGDPAC